jgi:DNA-binding CsgD family transcriptional regulator
MQTPWSISPEARRLYVAILHTHDPVAPEDAAALEELLAFGLAVPHPAAPAGRYIALNPAEAAGQRRDLILTEIAAAMTGAAALPAEVQDLAIAWQYRPNQRTTAGGVEHLDDLSEINGRISELVAQTTREMLTAQPGGPRPAASLAMALQRDLEALRRGVAMRTLYRDTVRSDEPTARWVRETTAVGAQVRTTSSPFLRSLVFDRRVAVLSDHTPWTGRGPEPPRALIIEDEAVVHYVAAMFDHEWSRASVWKGATATGPRAAEEPLTSRQVAIAQQLAAGASQAAVATVLGVSERVVQNELAAMRRATGTASIGALLFELGRRAGQTRRA